MRLSTVSTFLQCIAVVNAVLPDKMTSPASTSDNKQASTGDPKTKWFTTHTHNPPADPKGDGFSRFQRVTDKLRPTDRLFRSSAPHYRSSEADQILTPASIKFLKDNSINQVIGVNSLPNMPRIRNTLAENDVAYVPLVVTDMQAPTLEGFMTAYKAFRSVEGTLVWCAYGYGRSGTVISALQILRQYERSTPVPLTESDYRTNRVESEKQIQALNKLKQLARPGNLKEEIRKALKAFHEAQAAAKKTSTKIETAAAVASIRRAREAVANVDKALDFNWEVDMSVMDRVLRTAAIKRGTFNRDQYIVWGAENTNAELERLGDRLMLLDLALKKWGERFNEPIPLTPEAAKRDWKKENQDILIAQRSAMKQAYDTVRRRLQMMRLGLNKLNDSIWR
ncbi:hypothetical protein CDD80_4696 [Ophiocordyceps camponoti-rufipedis]|uniref:Tyrosine specific protein phosphatases domain-containing protein n=1 Tax=Ophiocordyceps camponoti-rufipedis TaxID=2004952 RepID=A0A2C5XUV7_9HYPO|nr:hypothetical protein CDD80_4696 [Ophiocordyceps camponoti-rufipedis]